jgi:hypothetical protein
MCDTPQVLRHMFTHYRAAVAYLVANDVSASMLRAWVGGRPHNQGVKLWPQVARAADRCGPSAQMCRDAWGKAACTLSMDPSSTGRAAQGDRCV